MIAQIQGLQAFVLNQLSDVVQWQTHVRPDPEKATTGDHAFITIATPFNRYKMSICSSYIEPPPGAPLACRSLGTVTFYDPADNKSLIGPKADQTFTDISKHIHVRELTDALAGARREVAEASGDAAKQAHVRLAELAARAAKWGVAAKVPDGSPPTSLLPPVSVPVYIESLSETKGIARMGDAPPSGEAPWLNAPVLFITNPGEQISGMQEIAAICVKVLSHDRISLFMMPDHSEPSYRDNLPRRGSPAGNGKVHQFNCWDLDPHYASLFEGNRDVADLSALVNEVIAENAKLASRLAALEAMNSPPVLGPVADKDTQKAKYAARKSETV